MDCLDLDMTPTNYRRPHQRRRRHRLTLFEITASAILVTASTVVTMSPDSSVGAGTHGINCVYCCSCLVCVCCYVYLLHNLCIAVFTLDAGLLARSQYSEGPATGHLDTGFSWFPCVYKLMLRWFPRFQVATTCFSCSPPDLNSVVTNFIFCIHVK